MNKKNTSLQIGDIKCELVPGTATDRIVYMIYPEVAPLTETLLGQLSSVCHLPMAVIYVPSAQWNNYLTPWPEPGEAPGFPPFAGEAPSFLKTLRDDIIPQVEKTLGLMPNAARNLMGVSLSGLFTLWTWLQTDLFTSIACLSGSFWYKGFIDWFDAQTIPVKTGKAFFLLGRSEPEASVKAYRTVGVDTQAVVDRLQASGIDTTFRWVPGNHFNDPAGRARIGVEFLANATVNSEK